MIRRIQHNIAGAARARRGEKFALRGERRIVEAERRKVVRIQMNIVVVRHASGAGTERAPLLRKLRTALALGGNAHPLAQQRVPAEFGRRFGIMHHRQNTRAAKLL